MDNYFNNNNDYLGKENPSIGAFGNRIYGDQTLYEYLIEFLLVFVSKKIKTNNPEEEDFTFKFHQIDSETFTYFPDPRMGLKRFIFFKNSKHDTKFKIDEIFYNNFMDILEHHIENNSSQKENIPEIFQEFFYGFSAVLKNRSWYAQCLLPLVPEMIFSETIGSKSTRLNLHKDVDLDEEENIVKCENAFNTTQHSFLARGGEVYYSHILLGLGEDEDLRFKLEELLKKLLTNKHLSNLTNFLQKNWEKEGLQLEENSIDLLSNGNLKFIPQIYENRGKNSVLELINLLSCNIDNFKKLELLANGMMLQIFRMVHERSLESSEKKPFWVLDLCNDSTVKKISVIGYNNFENSIENILKAYIKDTDNNKFLSAFNEGKKHSINLIRKIGKEIGFIVPLKGPNMRMTLSENLIKFLVLSLIPPNSKMEFNSFLDKLFEKFGIVIGSYHSEIYMKENNLDEELAGYFNKNKLAFQELLKEVGFLRDLSDATSIVENPYENIEEGNDDL